MCRHLQKKKKKGITGFDLAHFGHLIFPLGDINTDLGNCFPPASRTRFPQSEASRASASNWVSVPAGRQRTSTFFISGLILSSLNQRHRQLRTSAAVSPLDNSS